MERVLLLASDVLFSDRSSSIRTDVTLAYFVIHRSQYTNNYYSCQLECNKLQTAP